MRKKLKNLGCQKSAQMKIIFAGKVIIKFKPEVKDREKNDLFNSLLYRIGADSVVQKFPNSRCPKEKYNKSGIPFVDISGIYEIYFNEDLSIEETINTLINLIFLNMYIRIILTNRFMCRMILIFQVNII